jgi:hypothetical protein
MRGTRNLKNAYLLVACFLFLACVPTECRNLVPPVHRAARQNLNAPVATASKHSPLDPSNFLVVIIAALILVYGANRALRPPFVDMGGTSGEASAYEEAAEAGIFLNKILQGHLFLWLVMCRRNAATHDVHVRYCIFLFIGAHILLYVRYDSWRVLALHRQRCSNPMDDLVCALSAAMSVLITILFSLISSLSLGALIYPYADRLTDNKYSREVEVP